MEAYLRMLDSQSHMGSVARVVLAMGEVPFRKVKGRPGSAYKG